MTSVADPAAVRESLQAASGRSSALLLLPEAELTFAFAEELITASQDLRLPVGVLPVAADPAVASGFLARLLRLRRLPGKYPHRSALYCDFMPTWGPGTGLLFGTADSRAFISALAQGIEAVVLHSHGNGSDFRVGQHVLCVQVGPSRPLRMEGTARCLPCQAGGRCRLDHKTSFVAFHGADAMRSRLVVMLSCSAHQPHDGLLDSRFLFTTALLRGAHAQGIVASTRINFGTPHLGVAVLRSLENGATLGEVALRINQLSSFGPGSYLCFGDPELRLPRTRPIQPRPGHGPSRGARRNASTTSHDVRAAYLFAADFLRSAGEASKSSAARLERQLREAAADGPRSGPAGHVIDEALAKAIARIGTRRPDGLAAWWRPLCLPAVPFLAGRCPRCAALTVDKAAVSVLYQGQGRIVRQCPRHRALADRPLGEHFRLDWLRFADGGHGQIRRSAVPAGVKLVVARNGRSRLVGLDQSDWPAVLLPPADTPAALAAASAGRFACVTGLRSIEVVP